VGLRRWHVVADLCRQQGLRHGAELGVREGRFAKHILETVPGSTILGVDLWQQMPPRQADGAETYEAMPMETYRRQALDLAARYHGRCWMLETDTLSAASIVPDASLDFVFIDADHTEAAVLSDIEAWTPKVRSGGFVIGHDIDWPSVRRAVEATGEHRRLADNVWIRPNA